MYSIFRFSFYYEKNFFIFCIFVLLKKRDENGKWKMENGI